jgi:hypothetical protein
MNIYLKGVSEMKKRSSVIAVLLIIALAIIVSGCGENPKNEQKVVVNEIEVMASAKILAESKVIEKDELPQDIKKISEAGNVIKLPLNMVSEVYTKYDAEKDEYSNLHDYKLLFSDETKTAQVSICKKGAPLRDYFFQAEDNKSSLGGTEATIYKYTDRYIVRLVKDEMNFDIETNGLSESEMVSFVLEVIK